MNYCMKNHTFFAFNWVKSVIFGVFLLGFSSLFAQTKDTQPIEEIYPELKWIFNRDADGIELPLPKQTPSLNLLDGLELPPQKPRNKWKFDE